MNIINRVGKYRTRDWEKRDVANITKIIVHHSAAKQENIEDDKILSSLMKTHTNQGWPGLSYHFVILPNGTIYQINDYNDYTYHDGTNYNSIGVLVHGYFHPPVNEKPTPAQLKSLKELLDHLCTEHPEFPADQDDVYGNRDVGATACPGDILYPYVTDYRVKEGQVDWSTGNVPPPQENPDKRLADQFRKLQEAPEASGVWYEAQDILREYRARIEEKRTVEKAIDKLQDEMKAEVKKKEEIIQNLNVLLKKEQDSSSLKDEKIRTFEQRIIELEQQRDGYKVQAEKLPSLIEQLEYLEKAKKQWYDKEDYYQEKIKELSETSYIAATHQDLIGELFKRLLKRFYG